VAGFIGSPPMNFFAARRTSHGIVVNDCEIETSGGLNVDSGIDAIVGVRPEDVQLGEAGTDDLPLAGRVVAVETLGAETLCHIETDLDGVTVEGGRLATGPTGRPAFLLRARGNRADLAARTVRLRVDIAALRVFDPRTGRAVDVASSRQMPAERALGP